MGRELSRVQALAAVLCCAAGMNVWGAETQGPSFRNDVLPVLTKASCNSGPCHGAASGKNGLKLSLRGYDPISDYQVLTRESAGRRVVRSRPEQSLILLKPTLIFPHGGGRRFSIGSREYQIIADWIAAGAPPPRPDEALVQSLSVSPAHRIGSAGDRLQLRVTAHFSDGSERDVTTWAKYSSSQESVASVGSEGGVLLQGPGEASISVWYSSHVGSSRLTIPYPAALDPAAYESAARSNYIDDHVLDKLEELHIVPAHLSSDAEFLRRAWLDTAGVLPDLAEVDSFMADTRPDKRARLVERLLERPEYVDYWTYKWSDLLLVSSRRLQPKAVWSYYQWIRRRVEANQPWDRLVQELLTATGSNLENGAVNFFLIHRDPTELSETVSQAFLGTSLTCARCHNHPMEKWTQDDYFAMANLFSRIRLKNLVDPAMNGVAPVQSAAVSLVSVPRGDLTHPRLGRPLPPRPLEGEPLDPAATADRRGFLAEWLTSAENPLFARALVNRVWANFMGRGLVDPVDDLRLTNPASNEELLAALTRDFIAKNFDVKALIRTILNSSTYQLSSLTVAENAADDRYYSHYLVRRLPAEVILDALSRVTGVPESFAGYPEGTRALQLPDTRVQSYFLTAFGRPARVQTCDCERQNTANLAQALHLVSGETLDRKLRTPGNLIDRLLESNRPLPEMVSEIYKRSLSRPPTAEEMTAVLGVLEADRTGLEDLLWSLLTSKEFLFNK